jgi:hypothetical protein
MTDSCYIERHAPALKQAKMTPASFIGGGRIPGVLEKRLSPLIPPL